MSLRALVYVQHLLGIGHLARIRRIASALAAAGVSTTVAEGGAPTGLAPAAGTETIRLTPVRVAADDMATLLHADCSPFGDADRRERRDALLGALDDIRPDILLIEAFPFGRRQMRFELLPLLEQARKIGVRVVASSIRDILQDSWKPGRAEEAVETLGRFFDLVLVHGDPQITPLSMTFPLADRISIPVRYTGLVGPEPPRPAAHAWDVVVSAGGGVVGARLLETAVRARPSSPLAEGSWLLLAGPNLPDSDFARLEGLAAQAGGGVTFLRNVPDLAARLASARLSISQAGYNTVADILASGCAAVLCPFAAGGETEQTARANALAAAGRATVVPESALSPDLMVHAIAAAIALPTAAPVLLDGAERTAKLLGEFAGGGRPGRFDS